MNISVTLNAAELQMLQVLMQGLVIQHKRNSSIEAALVAAVYMASGKTAPSPR